MHKEVRNSILTHEYHPGCQPCWERENAGFKKSMRAIYDGPRDKEAVLENKFKLKFMVVTLDNVCNLACTMCSKSYSSKWASEESRMYGTPLIKSRSQPFPHLYEHATWKDMEELALYGGEPLYSKNCLSLLNWLIDEGFSKNIKISFYTNGSIFSEKIVSLFESFKSIELIVSVDAASERFELLRWPSSWKTLIDNFDRFSNIPNVSTNIHCIFSMLNAYHLVDDLQVIRKELSNRISFDILKSPEYYSAKHLPDHIKQNLIDQYSIDKDAQLLIPILKEQGNLSELTRAYEMLKTLDYYRKTNLDILGPIFF
jgi:MoaA/NifB/PqqE/SkfB family radical SAM enzyme